MIWESSDHPDYRVVAYTGWRYLGNYGTLEDRARVYLFANADLQIKYVEKAGALSLENALIVKCNPPNNLIQQTVVLNNISTSSYSDER